jgi:hypothetical protein
MTLDRQGEHGLDALARRINDEHRRCEEAVNAALEHALRAGELLIKAKSQCSHGTWQAWLAGNFEGSVRTAQAYMRVAHNRETIEAAKAQSSAPLSLDGALKALSTPKDGPTRTGPPPTLEALEGRAEEALSQARAGALEIAESLTTIYRGRGYEHRGYESFADYVTGEFAGSGLSFPIPYEVISDDDGAPLPVFAMAESIHAWGTYRVIDPLLQESAQERRTGQS